MPGVKRPHDRVESEAEEAEHESDSDRERSTAEEEEESSEAASDSEDSSELDEEECDRRRGEFITNLNELERQFSLLREQLYQERVLQVQNKLEEVKVERAVEYSGPLEELQEALKVHLQVSGILRSLKIQNISNKHEAEILSSNQNFQNEKEMLVDLIKSDLEEKIRRLEEDRNNVDVTSQVWEEENLHRKHTRHRQGSSNSSEHRRRKPTTVSGPFIVYMLRDPEIMEDWTTIKKALTACRRKHKSGKISQSSPRHFTDTYTI